MKKEKIVDLGFFPVCFVIGVCLIPVAAIIAIPDFIKSIRSAKW